MVLIFVMRMAIVILDLFLVRVLFVDRLLFICFIRRGELLATPTVSLFSRWCLKVLLGVVLLVPLVWRLMSLCTLKLQMGTFLRFTAMSIILLLT